MVPTFLHSPSVPYFSVGSPHTDPPLQVLLILTVAFTDHLYIGCLVFPECDPAGGVVVYPDDPRVASTADPRVLRGGELWLLLGERVCSGQLWTRLKWGFCLFAGRWQEIPNNQTISSKKMSSHTLNSYSRNYFKIVSSIEETRNKTFWINEPACKYLSFIFFSFIYWIFCLIFLKISAYFIKIFSNHNLYLF